MHVWTKQNPGRRSFLKTLGATGAVVTAAGAGLLKPIKSLAADFPFPKKAFDAEGMEGALQAALGTTNVSEGNVSLKAPTIAENGAVVPVTASADLDNVAKFHIFVAKNPRPYVARFHMIETGRAEVATRIKMGETSPVVAVAETTDGKYYKATKKVRVTIGGCGG